MLKRNVLRKKSDFSAIYNKGKSIGDRYVVLFYQEKPRAPSDERELSPSFADAAAGRV